MKKLYGVMFEGRYACFDANHKCCSENLFNSAEEAENYIPEYIQHVERITEEMHQGFYSLDKDYPYKTKVISFNAPD